AISSTWIIRALDSETRRGSSHALDLLGQDLDGDADFTGTPVTVAVLTRVLLGERVDVLVGSLLGHLDDSPADLEVSVRVVGILDREGDVRISPAVLGLHAYPARAGPTRWCRRSRSPPASPAPRRRGRRSRRGRTTSCSADHGSPRAPSPSSSLLLDLVENSLGQPIVVVSSAARASAIVRSANSIRITHCCTSTASWVN